MREDEGLDRSVHSFPVARCGNGCMRLLYLKRTTNTQRLALTVGVQLGDPSASLGLSHLCPLPSHTTTTPASHITSQSFWRGIYYTGQILGILIKNTHPLASPLKILGRGPGTSTCIKNPRPVYNWGSLRTTLERF